MRTASLNCHYFILMANKRDTLQISNLGRQIFPDQLKFFMQSFTLATDEIWLPLNGFNAKKWYNLSVAYNNSFEESRQLYTNIIPGDSTIVYQLIKWKTRKHSLYFLMMLPINNYRVFWRSSPGNNHKQSLTLFTMFFTVCPPFRISIKAF